ncbi:MAG: 2OG-Fe(II) oxygenase, partial [Candidatus Binatia bacterium]
MAEHQIDWEQVRSHLDERGFAVMSGVLTEKHCDEIAALYADDHRFRSRIDMSRYSFGQGE